MNLKGHSLRLAAAIGAGTAVGVGVGLLAPAGITPLMRLTLGFDAGALLYLATVWQHLLSTGEALSAAAEEDQGHVFERFGHGRHDVATADKGSGLGLAIVKGFAEAHDGTVTLESEFGLGTRVTVTLPPERLVRTHRAVA